MHYDKVYYDKSIVNLPVKALTTAKCRSGYLGPARALDEPRQPSQHASHKAQRQPRVRIEPRARAPRPVPAPTSIYPVPRRLWGEDY